MSTLRWNGPAVLEAIRAQSYRGVQAAADHVLGVSVNRAPKDRGDLRLSARTIPDPTAQTVAVSYDTPYAVVQHEELDYHHDVGQAKFLESAAIDSRDQCRALIAAAIKRGL